MSEIVKHETAFSIGQNKIANNDFFKELQTTLLESITSDYEMVKKEGAKAP